MGRPASTETQLRTAHRTVRQLHADLARARQDLLMYKARATLHERTITEWKRRFDALLKILPSETEEK